MKLGYPDFCYNPDAPISDYTTHAETGTGGRSFNASLALASGTASAGGGSCGKLRPPQRHAETGIGILLNETVNGLVESCWIQEKLHGYEISSSQDCVVRNFTAWNNDYYGFYLVYTDHCILENNTAELQHDGFYLDWSTYCTIRDSVAVDHMNDGFGVYNSDDNTLTGNQAYLNANGVHLQYSERCVLVNNDAIGSHSAHAQSDGFRLEYSQRSVLEICQSSDNQRHGVFLYWSPLCAVENNSMIGNGIHGLAAWNSGGSTFSDNKASQNGDSGMYVWNSDACILTKNNASHNSEHGVHLYTSSDCRTYRNEALGNTYDGFYLESSENTVMLGDVSKENAEGFYLYYAHNSTLRNCIAHLNEFDGIELEDSDNCTIVGNQVSNHSVYGIWIRGTGSGCELYYNLLMFNGQNAFSSHSPNTWDDSASLGNFWDDHDGEGNYTIAGDIEAVDRYPKTAAYYITEMPPRIDHPEDILFEAGTTGNSVRWCPRDYSPDTYEILRNGVPVTANEWDGWDIDLNLDGLGFGVFNYTILINDTYGHWTNDTVFVTVMDTTPPVLPGLDDVAYEAGSIGNELIWLPMDFCPDSYEIYLDSVLNKTGAWDGEAIRIYIDGLEVGEHNYTLVIIDKGGNTAVDTVLVTVTEAATTTTTTSTTTETTTSETTTSSTTSTGSSDPTTLILMVAGVVGAVVVLVLFSKLRK